MNSQAYTVRSIDNGECSNLLDRETYEAAHYEAYGIWQQTGLRTEVLRGDVMIWNARDGYCAD